MPRRSASCPKPQTPTQPAPEEWDFSECPDEEVEDCCFYEYARESEGTRRRVEQIRAEPPRFAGLHPGDWAYYEDKWFRTFFGSFVEFPDSPWLRIEAGKRSERLKECARYTG